MRKDESGQALVLVLLSLSVVLTLILYIMSRSVTDVAVSSRQEAAVRAFSAAEAGIERSLVTGVGYPDETFIGNASYTTIVSSLGGGVPDFPFPNPISSGDTVTVWFVSHDTNGDLICSSPDYPCFTGTAIEVCWGNSGYSDHSDYTPAIEVSVFYRADPLDANSLIRVGRAAVDPYIGRPDANSFDKGLDGGICHIGEKTYAFHRTINFSDLIPGGQYGQENGLQFAQIKMFYNDIPHAIGVSLTGGNLPSQGRQIDSSGVAGDSNRRVVVHQEWPEFPFASSTIISPGGIIK